MQFTQQQLEASPNTFFFVTNTAAQQVKARVAAATRGEKQWQQQLVVAAATRGEKQLQQQLEARSLAKGVFFTCTFIYAFCEHKCTCAFAYVGAGLAKRHARRVFSLSCTDLYDLYQKIHKTCIKRYRASSLSCSDVRLPYPVPFCKTYKKALTDINITPRRTASRMALC